MSNITKVSDRAKLKARREPYWAKISKGCFVGFRKMTAGASGTWVARNLDEASGKQQFKALETSPNCPTTSAMTPHPRPRNSGLSTWAKVVATRF